MRYSFLLLPQSLSSISCEVIVTGVCQHIGMNCPELTFEHMDAYLMSVIKTQVDIINKEDIFNTFVKLRHPAITFVSEYIDQNELWLNALHQQRLVHEVQCLRDSGNVVLYGIYSEARECPIIRNPLIPRTVSN